MANNSHKAFVKHNANAFLFAAKSNSAYMDYRKHGQLEWTPIAIIFGCLLFTLTAPLYVWTMLPN